MALPNMCFFLSSGRIRLLPISENNSWFREIKKHLEKKQIYFRRWKKKFQLCFYFACFFFVALINLFSNRPLGRKFFMLSPSLTFLENCQMFINFSKNRFNVLFLKCFFLPRSLIRFWLFSDLKQRNKTQGLKGHENKNTVFLWF